MKMSALIVLLAVLVAPAHASAALASGTARAWLQNHEGSPDELAELKGANPEAFAIVQALLTKRSLGLLDNKHPTASMSDSAPASVVQRQPKQTFDKFGALVESSTEVKAVEPVAAPRDELPYANVKTSHKDWLNWKPHSSAADDNMVSNVMAMVSGAKAVPEATASADAPANVAAPQPIVESAPKATSDWGSIGSMLGMRKHVQQRAAPPQADSLDAVLFHPEDVSQAVARKPNNDWNAMEKNKQSSDDKAVTNLLNMVASLKGKKAEKLLSNHHIQQTSALDKDLAAWGDVTEDVPQSAPMEMQAETAAPAMAPAARSMPVVASTPATENSWASIGGSWGAPKKPHHRAAAIETTASVSGSASRWLNWKPKAPGADEAMVANVLGMVGKGAVDAPAATAEATAVPQEVVSQAQTQPSETAQPAQEDKDSKAVNSLLNMVAQLKGGKAAEKLLKKHHVDSEENALQNDVDTFNSPAATPVAEAPAPKDNSWGSIGGMWGVRPKAQVFMPTKPQAAVEELSAGAMPSEVQALVSDTDAPAHRAPPRLRKKDDYTSELKAKQDHDDTAVKRLLSMVAQLKGSPQAEKLAENYDQGNSRETQQNLLSKDMVMFSGEAQSEEVQEPGHAAEVQEVAAKMLEPVPEAPTRRKNLFLDSLTSSLAAPEKPHRHLAAPAKENSYLKGLDLVTDSENTVKTGFPSSASDKEVASWFSDSAEEKPKKQEKARRNPKEVKLMSWLDNSDEQRPPQVAPVIARAPAVNRYLVDLN